MKLDLYFDKIPKSAIEDFHKIIASNVKKFRKEKNLTQLEMAHCMGIESVAFYSNCENLRYGKHFNIEHIFKISKILEVDIGEFFK